MAEQVEQREAIPDSAVAPLTPPMGVEQSTDNEGLVPTPPPQLNPQGDTSEQPHKGGRPSISDMLIQPSRGQFDVVHAMTSTSYEPHEFVPRSVVTAQEAARYCRMLVEEEMLELGAVDLRNIMWWKLCFSIATNGRGREDAVMMHTGQSTSGIRGRLGKFFGRMGKAEQEDRTQYQSKGPDGGS